MQKGEFFKIIVLVILGFIIVISSLIFAGVLPGFKRSEVGTGGTVTLWGSAPTNKMAPFISDFNRDHQEQFKLEYSEIPAEEFNRRYLESLARGQGPDLVLVPDDFIFENGDTLYTILPETYSLRDFQNTYINGADIFQSPNGLLALPISVDPLVMYINRDILSTTGLTRAPKTWTEVLEKISQVNKIGANQTIDQSLLALGEFDNIHNAKHILEALVLQTGNPIYAYNSIAAKYESWLASSLDLSQVPAVAALNFYTQFSNKSKNVYSWNPSIPEDRQFFAAGKLATYFGFAGELGIIKNLNPNLSLDTAELPQRGNEANKVTRGKFRGIGIVKTSDNFNTAFQVAFALAGGAESKYIASTLGEVPVRRDILALLPADPHEALFYQVALYSKSWLDPEPEATRLIFREMVNSVNTRERTSSSAVSRASGQINALYEK